MGDTANPGTADAVEKSYRSLGQPQSKEDFGPRDGWPFRMSEKNAKQRSPIEVAVVRTEFRDLH